MKSATRFGFSVTTTGFTAYAALAWVGAFGATMLDWRYRIDDAGRLTGWSMPDGRTTVVRHEPHGSSSTDAITRPEGRG
jgi:YD repeat-containing protein